MPYLGARPTDVFADRDLNGQEFILDADADTSITADTDDQIDIRIAGADDFQLTANTFTVLSGSTLAVASGATIANSGTATGFSASTLDAATTVGDGTAEDTKIVFDGNAQDFHIGLDDTADDLVIGKGSALGTTTHMAFTEDGEVTKPLNPYFNAKSVLQSNVTGDNTGYTVLFATEQDDVGANYNTSNGTFTAPVTGNYQFNAVIQASGYSGNETLIQMYFNTSNEGAQDYDTHVPNAAVTNLYGAGVTTFGVSAAFQMDASDTIIVQFYVNGTGGKTVDVAANGVFSGYLIG
jgi:hypothetical protein